MYVFAYEEWDGWTCGVGIDVQQEDSEITHFWRPWLQWDKTTVQNYLQNQGITVDLADIQCSTDAF